MDLWFTSDTHFQHFNVISYCSRPFKTLEEMDRTLIERWNERVKQHDMVVFLGDFIFKSGNELRGEGAKHDWKYYRDQLNGEIVFCRGNHCLNNGLNTHIISLIVELANKEIYCCHNPIDITNGLGLKYNLCGHVHEKWKTKKYVINKIPTYIINVGVDSNNFYPVSASEIIETFAKMEK